MSDRVQGNEAWLRHIQAVSPLTGVPPLYQDTGPCADFGQVLPLGHPVLIEPKKDAFTEHLDGWVYRLSRPVGTEIRSDEIGLGVCPFTCVTNAEGSLM